MNVRYKFFCCKIHFYSYLKDIVLGTSPHNEYLQWLKIQYCFRGRRKSFIARVRTLHNHRFRREANVVCSLAAIIPLEFTHEKATTRRIPAATARGCAD